MDSETKAALIVVPTLGLFVLGLVLLGMWGCPQYTIYQQRLLGESELAKANYSKQVSVQEAIAKQDAASHLADAEIARAKGVAGANKIIGDSLKNNEGYLRWLYIEALKEKSGTEVIYVPTEAGLPILEAGKRSRVNN